MAAELKLEVYRASRDAQTRYEHVLLTAAGAGVAFALNQTAHSPLSWFQLPLALAVLSWLASFASGCIHLRLVNAILLMNLQLLKVQSGEHELAGKDPARIRHASQLALENIETMSERSGRYSTIQWCLLIVGALAYAIWQVLEMYELRVS